MDSGVLPFLKNQKIWQCRVLFSYGRVQPGHLATAQMSGSLWSLGTELIRVTCQALY